MNRVRVNVTLLAGLGLVGLLLVGCEENLTRPPERGIFDPGGMVELSCVPNLDGVIDEQELQTALNTPISYLVSPTGTTPGVDLGGQVDGAGTRQWFFLSDDESDLLDRVQAKPLKGAWYESTFPQGQFILEDVAAGQKIANVYRRDETGLFLLGTASLEEMPAGGQTLLKYDTPVALTRFPLTDGKEWVTRSQVKNATFFGLPYAANYTYRVKVEGVGKMVLPDLIFDQVHMVRTNVLVEPAVGASSSVQQVSFFAECFGEVVRVVSQADEKESFFNQASSVRRLGIGYDDGQAPAAGSN